jgi:hypothetical protein
LIYLISIFDEARGGGLKSLVDNQQSVKYWSTYIKTLELACTATSLKDRQIRAYSISLNIIGKLGCPNQKNRRRK